MSGNIFGKVFQITTFGESHGLALGVIVDGCPAGFAIDIDLITKELERRRPGQSHLATQRKESDKCEILSGLFEGKTTGAPIMALVHNEDKRSQDYESIKELFRPGHADYTYWKKYGIRDYRGGGRSSARETVARVIGGAIAKQYLAQQGMSVRGAVVQIGNVKAVNYQWDQVEGNEIRSVDPERTQQMVDLIEQARSDKNSVGGVVEVQALGVPAGLGEPVFDKLDAVLAYSLMSIPAVKGVEVGRGFAAAELRGSEMNDQMFRDGFHGNNHGGILGGISSGNPIVVRAAFKPTSSLPQAQQTIDIHGEEREITTLGRHDPCVAIRGLAVAEAMVALSIMDALLVAKAGK
ncbi:MAG: chorismate synthase [Deltaproteobacteria bacterium]|nr:chorismate synthase [Deltaproteobacteria bacterium]